MRILNGYAIIGGLPGLWATFNPSPENSVPALRIMNAYDEEDVEFQFPEVIPTWFERVRMVFNDPKVFE
jgi:hypothetical protein